jgi:hypothetical protein
MENTHEIPCLVHEVADGDHLICNLNRCHDDPAASNSTDHYDYALNRSWASRRAQ